MTTTNTNMESLNSHLTRNLETKMHDRNLDISYFVYNTFKRVLLAGFDIDAWWRSRPGLEDSRTHEWIHAEQNLGKLEDVIRDGIAQIQQRKEFEDTVHAKDTNDLLLIAQRLGTKESTMMKHYAQRVAVLPEILAYDDDMNKQEMLVGLIAEHKIKSLKAEKVIALLNSLLDLKNSPYLELMVFLYLSKQEHVAEFAEWQEQNKELDESDSLILFLDRIHYGDMPSHAKNCFPARNK